MCALAFSVLNFLCLIGEKEETLDFSIDIELSKFLFILETIIIISDLII